MQVDLVKNYHNMKNSLSICMVNFRKKCVGKMMEFVNTTAFLVFYVQINMSAVKFLRLNFSMNDIELVHKMSTFYFSLTIQLFAENSSHVYDSTLNC